MTNNIYRILLTSALLVISIMMPAADLPSLPVAPQIKTGMLDNGIAYYLVTNHTEKGKADIALPYTVSRVWNFHARKTSWTPPCSWCST